MRINYVEVNQFQGIDSAEITAHTPIVVVAGSNAAGKSSLIEAMRYALLGAPTRIPESASKKVQEMLIRNGASRASIEVGITRGDAATSHLATVPGGAARPLDVPGLEICLDPSRFASMAPRDRLAALFSALGVTPDGKEVRDMLAAEGVGASEIEEIAPYLRAGFEAAKKQTEDEARAEKRAWRERTGETWGSEKGGKWRAPVVDLPAARDFSEDLANLDAQIEEKNRTIGAMQETARRIAQERRRATELSATACGFADASRRVRAAEKRVAQIEKDLGDLRARLGDEDPLSCPKCSAALVLRDGALVHATVHANPADPQDVANAEEFLRAAKGDLADAMKARDDADAAARLLDEMKEQEAPQEENSTDLLRALEELKDRRRTIGEAAQAYEEAARKNEAAAGLTEAALGIHQKIIALEKLGALLAPDGIPARLLNDSIEKINARLREAAEITGWKRIILTPEGGIYSGLGLPYGLFSESEKWRADAMIGAALADATGLRILLLDRFDVLDLPSRGRLLAWMQDLVSRHEIESAWIFGTLKARPNLPPESITAVWIEAGRIASPEAAAA